MSSSRLLLFGFLVGCSGAQRVGALDVQLTSAHDLGLADQAAAPGTRYLAINEVNPHGTDLLTDPEWVELQNVSQGPVSLKDYQLADSVTTATLPDVMLLPGAYALILCDDTGGGGSSAGIHVPFQLRGKGEQLYLRFGDSEADQISWGAIDVPAGKTWARFPDGSGAFAAATPTPLASNQP